jgi:hypothetical protein
MSRLEKEAFARQINKATYFSNRSKLLELDLKDEVQVSTARSNIIVIQDEKISIYRTKYSWSFIKGLTIAVAFIIGFLSSK